METKQELITNLEGAITLGKQKLAKGGVDTTNIHSVYGVVKAIPESGINWENNKLIITAADVENASTVTLDNTTYVKVSDKDTLIKPEDSYIYTLGYIDQYSVDYSVYNSSTEESGYLNIIPFWNFYTQELKTSTNLIYHKIGLPTAAAVCYIIHTNGTVIGNQTLDKGLWISLNTTTNIPFTIFRTQATESLQDITIVPSTVYTEDNYIEIEEFGGTDMPSGAIPTLKTYTGYKVSDNFLPIATGFIKSNSTSTISGDGSHVCHYYDSTNKKFGLCTYDDSNGTTYPKIVSVSDDKTTIAISYGQHTNTKYHKMITLPEKGTYIFCDTLNIINDITGLAIYADGCLEGFPLGFISTNFQAYINQTQTPLLKYDYNGLSANTLILQDSTILKTPTKGASITPIEMLNSGHIDINGTGVSATNANISDLVQDQQIGPYSYIYTCSTADDSTIQIFAYINDFVLSDGTFVSNPGIFTPLNELSLNLDSVNIGS